MFWIDFTIITIDQEKLSIKKVIINESNLFEHLMLNKMKQKLESIESKLNWLSDRASVTRAESESHKSYLSNNKPFQQIQQNNQINNIN